MEQKYSFTNEWFSEYHRTLFERYLLPLSEKQIALLEIGAHEGRSSTWMIDHYLSHDRSTLTIIDPYISFDKTTSVTTETRNRFIANIKVSKYPSKVNWYEDISSQILPMLFTEGKQFDAIYVDGSHLTRDVLEDAVLTEKICKPEGLIVFDDYASQYPKQVLDRFLEVYGGFVEILHREWCLVLRKKVQHKIIDVFLFNNELDMLELRLREHNSAVDRFVLVESRKTFSGKEKKLIFDENKKRFSPWLSKIDYLIIDSYPITGAWPCEFYSRNYALNHIRSIASSNDYVLSSDLDEIVRSDLLTILKGARLDGIHHLEMDMYYYNCHWKKRNIWNLAAIGPLSAITSLQALRETANQTPSIPRAGWHLSYFFTPELIAVKLASFAHTEYDKDEYKSFGNISDAILTGRDLFKRGGSESCIGASSSDTLPKYISCLPEFLQRKSSK